MDRTAILPFQNLSGDTALERFSIPLQSALQTMIGSRIPAGSQAVAILNGASAIATGILERSVRSGRFLARVEIFDVSSNKLLKSVAAEGSDPFESVKAVAGLLTAQPLPLGNRNPQTLELWTTVLNTGQPAQLIENCRKLVEAEPAFSPGYSSCFNIFLEAFQKPDLLVIAERAYNNRQSLNLEAKNGVGLLLFRAGSHQHAAELLREAAVVYPGSWNQVGYAEARQGHADESQKALENYRKLGGDEPNAVDSMGEAKFLLKRYDEAEKYFIECADKFPQTPQGSRARLKAAAVRALRGDKAGAEELAQKFFEPLRKTGNPNLKTLEEVWRNVILEQDPAVMQQKIAASLIVIP
jgi:tetratricopeptide (TPR) repeat protein